MIGTAKADATGNYSVTLDKAYTNGEALSVTAKDAANNQSAAKTVTAADTTAPALTTATLATDGSNLSGKTESNATVEVKYQDKVIGTAKADATGNYSVTLDKAYTNGEALSVTAKDAANNQSMVKTIYASANALTNTTVDFELVPEYTEQTTLEDTIVISQPGYYGYLNTQIPFTISGENGYISLLLTSTSTSVQASYSYTIQGNGLNYIGSNSIGIWGSSSLSRVINEDSPLPAGDYYLSLNANTNDYNNGIEVRVTEQLPTTQEVFLGYDEVIGSIFADTDQKPENYQIKVGDTIIQHKAGQPVTTSTVELEKGVLSIKSDGTYSYTPSATQLSDDATDKLTIQILDVNGKSLATHQATVAKDIVPPEAGTLSLVDFVDTGALDSDHITQDNSFGFKVQGNETDSTVTYEYSTDKGVTWTAITGASVSGLEDGDYQFRAKVSDLTRNNSYTNVIDVTIDNQAPDLFNAITTDYNLDTALIGISTPTDYDLALYKVIDGVRSKISDLNAIPFEVGSYEAELTDVAGNESVQSINIALSTTARYTAKDSVLDIVYTSRANQEVYGKDRDDILITDGETYLYGEAGNDTLIHMGALTNYTYLGGDVGDDTYIINLANKNIYAHILDYQGNNDLYLRNVLPEELGFETSSFSSLALTLNGRTAINIYEQLASGGVNYIHFDNGTIWDREYIQQIIG